jgi:hypothetical protein
MRCRIVVVVMMLVVVQAAGVGCRKRPPEPEAGQPATTDWHLIDPPLVRDDRYPRGHRVHTSAPIETWHAVARFPTLAACETAMKQRIDESIDRARVVVGEDAKNDLEVRRNVHAHCVQPKTPPPPAP